MATKRKRRNFTPEYRAEVVRLARTTGKNANQIARELDLTPTSVRAWMKQAAANSQPHGASPSQGHGARAAE